MTHDTRLKRAVAELLAAQMLLQDEIRDYPTPVSGCDAQYNHLISIRNSVSDALRSLREPGFVATPRTPYRGAGIESR